MQRVSHKVLPPSSKNLSAHDVFDIQSNASGNWRPSLACQQFPEVNQG